MVFVTLCDKTDLALDPSIILGVMKNPDGNGGAVVFTEHGNFSSNLSPEDVKARVETALTLGTH